MNKQKIIFRADGNSEIGLGHVVRSLALSGMLHNDFECEFATRFLSEFIKQEANKVCGKIHLLPEDDNTHFEVFLDILTGDEIVVLDNYFFTTEYQKQIKGKGCKLVCIDDIHDKHYVADVVINHAPGIYKKDYSVESYTKICLGLNYALLREPFMKKIQEKRIYKDKVENIVICFGGADKLNLTKKICNEILETDFNGNVTAIIGGAYQYKDSLNKLRGQIIIKEKLSAQDMANEFWTNDLAIVPCSSVLFEALACQTPVITGAYVDNQNIIAEYFRKNSEVKIKDFAKNSLDKGNLQNVKYKKFIEEGTTKNFIKLFRCLELSKSIIVREARNEDVKLIFTWANNIDVRQNSFNSEPISFPDHKEWFYKKLLSPDSYIYIATANNIPIGQVRFDIYDKDYYIDYSIDKDYRGYGLGSIILNAAIKKLMISSHILHNEFIGLVKLNNLSSCKVFETLKFKKELLPNNIIRYVLRK